ncbi:MAG: phosphoethanolamine transferase [Prevotella sp.]|nr:phosphoethanolamine transferase [Prevotella sp.]
MKHFKYLSFTDLLVFIVPIALVLPNVCICLFGSMSAEECAALLLLPFGFYLGLMTLSANTPRTTVSLFPMMFIGAFQIVVSYLYLDGSPIGVDMFLNVWTTNLTEVDELLRSILLPVVIVVLLYLPLTVAAAISWHRHQRAVSSFLRRWRYVALAVGASGMAACTYCIVTKPVYEVHTNLFPVNAFYNLKEALVRQFRMDHYRSNSENFRYRATSTHQAGKELYIAVIGETSRADNWQILGYDRRTTPLLSSYGDRIIAYKNVFSESNTTHKSVTMLLNTLSSEDYNKGIYSHKSIITAFNEAGFNTSFFSIQRANHSMVETYSKEAQTVKYIAGNHGMPAMDEKVLPMVDSVMADRSSDKKLIVLHLYGSHYDYADRYPSKFAVFKPDRHQQANVKHKHALINAYDNTIVYTDYVLSELISRLQSVGYSAALIYTSDHGEDIFDDARGKFLHASPKPTYWQLHVPLLVYMNSAYTDANPALRANALNNRPKLISSSRSYAQTLLHLAGIATPYAHDAQSLLSANLKSIGTLHYLTDINESADLMEWGFGDNDKLKFKQLLSNEQH